MTEAHLWADTYDRKLTDIFAVESEIAKRIADTLQAKLSSSANHVLASRPTENPEAHELYLKGRYFWNRRTGENLQKAADYFQQAIEKDASYALAYSGLADCHVLLPLYPGLGSNPRDELPKALEAARKAVELDDTLAEAHTSLARALASDLQLSAAMSEFNRAIELNPNYATAHQWFGECLQSQGRVEDAVAELKRAQELDPLSLIINSLLGFALDTVGKGDRSDRAIAQNDRDRSNLRLRAYAVRRCAGAQRPHRGSGASSPKSRPACRPGTLAFLLSSRALTFSSGEKQGRNSFGTN